MPSSQRSNPSPYSDAGHDHVTSDGASGAVDNNNNMVSSHRSRSPHLSSYSAGEQPTPDSTAIAPLSSPQLYQVSDAMRTSSGVARNRPPPVHPPPYTHTVKSPLATSLDGPQMANYQQEMGLAGAKQTPLNGMESSGIGRVFSSASSTPMHTNFLPAGGAAPPPYETTVSRSASGTFHTPTPGGNTPLVTSLTSGNSTAAVPSMTSVLQPLPPGTVSGSGGGSALASSLTAPLPPSYAQYQRLAKSNSGSGHQHQQQPPRVTSQHEGSGTADGTPIGTSVRFMPVTQSTSGSGGGGGGQPHRQSVSLDMQHFPPPSNAANHPSSPTDYPPPAHTNHFSIRPRSASMEGPSDRPTFILANTSLNSPALDSATAPTSASTNSGANLKSPLNNSQGGGGSGGNVTVRVGGVGTPNSQPHSPSGSFRIPPGGISLAHHDSHRPLVGQGSTSNSSFSGRQESTHSMTIKVGGVVLPPTPTRGPSSVPPSTHHILSQRDTNDIDDVESFDDEEHGHISRHRADLPPPMPSSHQQSMSNNNSFSGGGLPPKNSSFAARPLNVGTPLSQHHNHNNNNFHNQHHQHQHQQLGFPGAMASGSNSGSFTGTASQWRNLPPGPHHHNTHSSPTGGPPPSSYGGGGGHHYPPHRQGGDGYNSNNNAPPSRAPPHQGNHFNNHHNNNRQSAPSTPATTAIVGVPVPQLNASMSSTQRDPLRDGTVIPSVVQRQCASLRVTRLPDEESSRIRLIDTDRLPSKTTTSTTTPTPAASGNAAAGSSTAAATVDSNTLLGFLTGKELVDTYSSVSEFLAAVTIPVKAHFNEYPTESHHQRIDRILHQARPTSSRPNSPSAPPAPVPVAVDGHYLLSRVRTMMFEHDPCWMLIHPCPPLLLHMLKSEVRCMRQRGIEPFIVFDGLSFSADVHESLVDCRDSLRAASCVWNDLHARSPIADAANPALGSTTSPSGTEISPSSTKKQPLAPKTAGSSRPATQASSLTASSIAAVSNAEENRRLSKAVKESTWVSEEANDITGTVFRYLVAELRVNTMYAPYSSWAQLGLMFSEGTVAAVMGPAELLAVEAPSLKVISAITNRDIKVLDKSKILDGLFGASGVPGPIHEFCDRYNTDVILRFQQHHQRQQHETYLREQRDRHMVGGGFGSTSIPPSSSSYFTASQTSTSTRSTPLPAGSPDPSVPNAAGVEGVFPFGVPPSITPMTPIRVASNLFQMLVLCKSAHPRLRYLRPSFLPPHYQGGWECLFRELSMNRALPNTTRQDIPPPPLYNTFLDLLRDREIPTEIKDIVKKRIEAKEVPAGVTRSEAERAELTEQLVRGVHCAKLGLLFLSKTPGFSTLATEERAQLFKYVHALIDDVAHNAEEGVWSGGGGGNVQSGGSEWCQQRGALMLVAPTSSLAMQNAMNRHHRPLMHCCEVERVELLESGGKAVDSSAGIDCMGPHSSVPLDCSPHRLPSGQVYPTQLVLGSVPAGLPKVLKQRLPAIANYLLAIGLINPALLDTAASRHPLVTTHTPLSDTLELRDKMKMMLLIQGQVIGFLAGILGTTLNRSPEWVRWFAKGDSGDLKESLFDTKSSLSDVIPTLRHWSLHDLLPTRSSGRRVVARQNPSDPLAVIHEDLISPHESAAVTLEDALLVVVAKGHAIKFVETTSLTVSSLQPPTGASTVITEDYGWEVYASCLGTTPPAILHAVGDNGTPTTDSVVDGTTTVLRAAPAASQADRVNRVLSTSSEAEAQYLEHNGVAQITAASILMSLEFLGYIDVNSREDMCCKSEQGPTKRTSTSTTASSQQANNNLSFPTIKSSVSTKYAKAFQALKAGTLRPLDVVRILVSHDVVPIQFPPDAAITGLSDLGCTLLRALRCSPISLLPPDVQAPSSPASTHQPTPLGASTTSTSNDDLYLRQTYSHLYETLPESDQGLLVILIELVRTGFLTDKSFNYVHYIVTEYKDDTSSSHSPSWDSDTDLVFQEARNIDTARDLHWTESSDMHGGMEDEAVALLTRIACLVPIQFHPTASWDADYDRRLTTFAQMAGNVQQTLRGLTETMAVRALVGNTTIVTPSTINGNLSSSLPAGQANKPLSPASGLELSGCAALPFALPFADTPSPIGGLLLKDFLTAVPPCPPLVRLVAAITEHPRPAYPLTPEEETTLSHRLKGTEPPSSSSPSSIPTPSSKSSSAKPAAILKVPSVGLVDTSGSLLTVSSDATMYSSNGRTHSPLSINAINLASGWLNPEAQTSWVERKYEGIVNVREELSRVLRFVRVALWVIGEVEDPTTKPLRRTVARARALLDHQEGLWAQVRAMTPSSPISATPVRQASSYSGNNEGGGHQQHRAHRHNPYHRDPTSPTGGVAQQQQQQQRPRRGRGGF